MCLRGAVVFCPVSGPVLVAVLNHHWPVIEPVPTSSDLPRYVAQSPADPVLRYLRYNGDAPAAVRSALDII